MSICDNKSVINSSSNINLTKNKKHSEIAFNFTRWNVESVVFTVEWIPTGENLAGAMTKLLSKITRNYSFRSWNCNQSVISI